MLIEEFYVNYLSDRIALTVSGSVRHPMPDSFVTVERTGSGMENKIRSATIAVQCWATTRDEAANLCETVEGIMLGSVADANISRCSLNSSYDFTDTTTKRYRYQAVFDVVHFLGGY